jgi:hypothetical protein
MARERLKEIKQQSNKAERKCKAQYCERMRETETPAESEASSDISQIDTEAKPASVPKGIVLTAASIGHQLWFHPPLPP